MQWTAAHDLADLTRVPYWHLVGQHEATYYRVNTALQTEVRRIAANDRFDSGTASGSYTEFGLFDAAAGGNLFSRTVFSPAISHTQNDNVFSLTEVVSQSSS